MSSGGDLAGANMVTSLPAILGACPRRDPAKGPDLESPAVGGQTPGLATNSSATTQKLEELEKFQRSRALLFGVTVLMIMQVVTHLFTTKLYAEANKVPPLYQEVCFYLGVLTSLSLMIGGCVARCCSCVVGVIWKRAVGALAAWTSFCCAVSFGAMVNCFPQICSFYSSTGVLGDETIEFTHIDCPRLLGDVPARVVATFMGHIYAGAAIGVLGGLVVMKPRLSAVVPRVAIDFVDLQDFALLLIDDEILKTFWGQAEGGYGGEWLWWFLFAICCSAVLSMMAELVYQYRRNQYATTSAASACSGAPDQDRPWSRSDNIMNASSLLFVEIPFLVMRTYTSLRFDVAPSSLVLKNMCSILKEVWELFRQTHLRLGFYGAIVGAAD